MAITCYEGREASRKELASLLGDNTCDRYLYSPLLVDRYILPCRS